MTLTLLYVPADRPDRVRRALAGDADAVIVDLEDAVGPARKATARAGVPHLLAGLPAGRQVQVRVNDVRGGTGRADLVMVASLAPEVGVRLPKVEDAATVRAVAELLPGRPLHPLLESALGVENAFTVATAHPQVAGIGLGEADLRADLGLPGGQPDPPGLAYPRSRIVVAARAAGLPAPAQSVYPDVRDLTGLAASCRAGRAAGFHGRAAIHPAQLPVIVEAYTPTAAELAAARELLAASVDAEGAGPGALALADGRFVDEAVLRTARQVVSLADRAGR
ncbi:MAG: CoA ester lyase [Actinocatenispora sp.]